MSDALSTPHTEPTLTPRINRWKVVALTFTTWLGFSVLAKIYVMCMQQRIPSYAMIDAQGVVWSWMSLLMGIYLAFRLKKWTEILFGILFFVACLTPIAGMFLGVAYFAWSYVKLERARLQPSNEQRVRRRKLNQGW